MWFAAVAGRVAYVAHLAAGHAVTWNASSQDSSACPGDILCHECGQVLWCRAHDPWRGARVEPAPDHWGGTRTSQPHRTLFENLQQILRLVEQCPPDHTGDEIRRTACELVEADTRSALATCRRRMLRRVVRLQSGSSRGSVDEPTRLLLGRLADALRRERWPG